MEPCPFALSPGQQDAYRHQGYLAFGNVLSASEVEQARQALSRLISQAQHVPDFTPNEKGSFTAPGQRLSVQLELGTVVPGVRALPEADFELRVRKLMGFCEADPLLHRLAHAHARIRGVVESLLGADPVLFQDMALIKPPRGGSEKPWHQDNAYFAVVPLEAVLGVWIALDDATVVNGCMHVLPGEHALGPRRHHHARDCEIVPGRIDTSRAVPVELPVGGAMFFAGMLPHQTPTNTSPARRRALQFHYRGAATRTVSLEEYDRVYAEADGTPASCAAAGWPA